MQKQDAFRKLISPGFLITILVLIFASTLAPNITWMHNSADGGDLITASATQGIPHPTGYPLYLLVARVFQLLPIGPLALRTNVMSAFFAILTALLVYKLVANHLQNETGLFAVQIAGLSAGLFLCLSPLFWSQAIITEVYTLNAFFVALILFISTQEKKSDRISGFIYGLATSNHLTALAAIPGALLTNLASTKNDRSRSITHQLLWMFVTVLLLYAILPLRAIQNPVINWGNPVSLKNFWWLVSGEVYRAYYLQDILPQLWIKLQTSTALLLQQFGVIGLSLGFFGLVLFLKSSKLRTLTIWNGISFWLITLVYQTADAHVYFIPVIISFSIWIGLCIGYGLETLSSRAAAWRWLVVAGVAIQIVYTVAGNWSRIDASQDHQAEIFAEQILTSAPQDAIVFTQTDEATFTLWYVHFALGRRPDLTIISTDLLHYDWYQQSMRQKYPEIKLPGPFPWDSTVIAANPEHPYCIIDSNNHLTCHKALQP